MTKYRFTLEKGSKKHICTDCGMKTMVRYIDNSTSQYLPDIYGRCDRESKCGYHLNPYKDGYAAGKSTEYNPVMFRRPLKPPTYYIPEQILEGTLKGYEINTFVQNLIKFAPVKEIEKVIALYRLGTITEGLRSGAITFPFIDNNFNIRAIQVKQFDNQNHTLNTDFIHSIIERDHTYRKVDLPDWLTNYLKNDGKVTCLFGEHFLNKYPNNPVALVESPKTAIICTLYYGFPDNPDQLIWLAVYNKSSLTVEKCKVLKGRNVVLVPDLNAFNEWKQKADSIKTLLPGVNIIVSNPLEVIATEVEIKAGLDIADFLIRFPLDQFQSGPTTLPP